MPNTWTKEPPTALVFDDTKTDDSGNTIATLKLTLTDTGSGEWSAHLLKNGADKGTLTLDTVADFKDLFTQVGAQL